MLPVVLAWPVVAPTFRGGRGLKQFVSPIVYTTDVAPTFRGGRGLKHLLDTAMLCKGAIVAPTFRGGRGLKQCQAESLSLVPAVAPTFRGGRGLKHYGDQRAATWT